MAPRSPPGAFGQVQPHRDFTQTVLYSGGTLLSPWGFWPGPATQGLHSNCPVQWWHPALPLGLLARSSHTGTSLKLSCTVVAPCSPPGAFGQVQPHRDFTQTVLYSGDTLLCPWGFWPGPATQGLHSNCPVQWWHPTLPLGLLARSSHTGTSL